jgi:hypothetical protein
MTEQPKTPFPRNPKIMLFGFLFRFLPVSKHVSYFPYEETLWFPILFPKSSGNSQPFPHYVHAHSGNGAVGASFPDLFPYVYCHRNQASGRLLPNLAQRRTARKEVVRQKPSRGIDTSARHG